jgi:nucleoid DNA-binding protein
MTKQKLAKKIIKIVDNYRFFNNTDEEIERAIESLFSVLEPKDKVQFAKWGMDSEKSTAEECW